MQWHRRTEGKDLGTEADPDVIIVLASHRLSILFLKKKTDTIPEKLVHVCHISSVKLKGIRDGTFNWEPNYTLQHLISSSDGSGHKGALCIP